MSILLKNLAEASPASVGITFESFEWLHLACHWKKATHAIYLSILTLTWSWKTSFLSQNGKKVFFEKNRKWVKDLECVRNELISYIGNGAIKWAEPRRNHHSILPSFSSPFIHSSFFFFLSTQKCRDSTNKAAIPVPPCSIGGWGKQHLEQSNFVGAVLFSLVTCRCSEGHGSSSLMGERLW